MVNIGVMLEAVKVVCTVVLLDTVTVQVLVGFGQAPFQLDNVFPADGAAVSCTEVPAGTVIVQDTLIVVQAIPVGDDVTVPDPLRATVSVATLLGVPEVGGSFPPPPAQPKTVVKTIARHQVIRCV
jgi:hypothetical protein